MDTPFIVRPLLLYYNPVHCRIFGVSLHIQGNCINSSDHSIFSSSQVTLGQEVEDDGMLRNTVTLVSVCLPTTRTLFHFNYHGVAWSLDSLVNSRLVQESGSISQFNSPPRGTETFLL